MTTEPATGFRHFHDQLGELKERLLEMSACAEELVELAVDAFVTRDAVRARAVIDADRQLDRMELEVEELGAAAGAPAADGPRPALPHQRDQGDVRPRARG